MNRCSVYSKKRPERQTRARTRRSRPAPTGSRRSPRPTAGTRSPGCRSAAARSGARAIPTPGSGCRTSAARSPEAPSRADSCGIAGSVAVWVLTVRSLAKRPGVAHLFASCASPPAQGAPAPVTIRRVTPTPKPPVRSDRRRVQPNSIPFAVHVLIEYGLGDPDDPLAVPVLVRRRRGQDRRRADRRGDPRAGGGHRRAHGPRAHAARRLARRARLRARPAAARAPFVFGFAGDDAAATAYFIVLGVGYVVLAVLTRYRDVEGLSAAALDPRIQARARGAVARRCASASARASGASAGRSRSTTRGCSRRSASRSR